MKNWILVLLAVVTLMAAGCQGQRFRTQSLGAVGYSKAFDAGQAVLAQYFSIESADAQSGEIVSRAKPVEAAPDRLLGSSPARKIARMRIRRDGPNVFADIRVEIQRQDVGAFRQMQPLTVSNELPSRTPAQDTAAVSAEQDQAWQRTGEDYELERAILADLIRMLSESR